MLKERFFYEYTFIELIQKHERATTQEKKTCLWLKVTLKSLGERTKTKIFHHVPNLIQKLV